MAVRERHLPSMGSSATVIVVGGTAPDIDHAVCISSKLVGAGSFPTAR
jgi:hypothetical protein